MTKTMKTTARAEAAAAAIAMEGDPLAEALPSRFCTSAPVTSEETPGGADDGETSATTGGDSSVANGAADGGVGDGGVGDGGGGAGGGGAGKGGGRGGTIACGTAVTWMAPLGSSRLELSTTGSADAVDSSPAVLAALSTCVATSCTVLPDSVVLKVSVEASA